MTLGLVMAAVGVGAIFYVYGRDLPDVEPLARYQHSTIFVGTLMIVLGGRTNTVGENV